MDKIKKLVGSVTQDDFVLGLLLARGVESSGDIWEKVIDCNHCKFAKQCVGRLYTPLGEIEIENRELRVL